jgi:hypothetical protein
VKFNNSCLISIQMWNHFVIQNKKKKISEKTMNSKNKRIKFEIKLWVKLFDEFQQSLKSMRCVTWDERKKKISIGWRHPFILRVCESRSELSLFSSLCDKLKINRDQLFFKMMEKKAGWWGCHYYLKIPINWSLIIFLFLLFFGLVRDYLFFFSNWFV